MQFWLFLFAVILALPQALSLFAKAESFRGAGRVCGGVSTIRQYLRAGLIDELHLAVRPVVLGA